MLQAGVWLPPSQFEAAFLSTAHTEADIRQTVDAARRRLRRNRSGLTGKEGSAYQRCSVSPVLAMTGETPGPA